MKKKEIEQFKCKFKSNQLIAGQGIWECMSRLEFKIEQSQYLDDVEIKELLRKLGIVRKAIDRNDKAIDDFLNSSSY